MKYGSLRFNDIANGPGVRVTLFVSGCRIGCPGCFNKDAQSFDYGQEFTEEIKQSIMKALESDHISGLTVLGGEPFEPENQRELAPFLLDVGIKYPDKDIWVYTGYVFDKDLLPGQRKYVPDVTDQMLTCIDVLVDGPFIEAQKDISLKFRGSKNQRVIPVWELPYDLSTVRSEQIRSLTSDEMDNVRQRG